MSWSDMIPSSNIASIYATIVFGLITVIVVFRLWMKATCGKFESDIRMDGKTVLITGANSGIGKETARDLARRGARVIMACRTLETANKARDEIIKETKNDKVIVKKLDLSSQKSVREFAADINKTEQKIDVLIHNAGYAETFKKHKTEDGIEMTMATNHYGPFLLTHLLIDLLKKSSPCRIVIVASELYRFVTVDLKKHINPIGILPGFLYYVSKGCNIMFGIELSKRLKTTGITVNMLHPGMIDSGIWRNVPFPLSIGMSVIKGFFKTTVEGAQTTLYLACSDEVKDVTGKYFYDCKQQALQPYIIIPQEHKILWEESAKMVKLSDADPKI